jgi:hypothetical protein
MFFENRLHLNSASHSHLPTPSPTTILFQGIPVAFATVRLCTAPASQWKEIDSVSMEITLKKDDVKFAEGQRQRTWFNYIDTFKNCVNNI